MPEAPRPVVSPTPERNARPSAQRGPYPVPVHRFEEAVEGPRRRRARPFPAGAFSALVALPAVIALVQLFYEEAALAATRPPFVLPIALVAAGLVAALLAVRVLARSRAWILLPLGALLGAAGGFLVHLDLVEVAKRTIPASWGLGFYGAGALLALGVPALVAALSHPQGKARGRWDRLAAAVALLTALAGAVAGVLVLLQGTA